MHSPSTAPFSPSTSVSSVPGRDGHGQGLHRRRGSAASVRSIPQPYTFHPQEQLPSADTIDISGDHTSSQRNPRSYYEAHTTLDEHAATTINNHHHDNDEDIDGPSYFADSLATLGPPFGMSVSAEAVTTAGATELEQISVIENGADGGYNPNQLNSHGRTRSHSNGSKHNHRNHPSIQSSHPLEREEIGSYTDGTTATHTDAVVAAGPVPILDGPVPALGPTATPLPTKPQRLRSLDILRGVTIVLMVLVNTQGADPFVQLAHTEWFGFTLADWVFPNFIFMVGMAIAIVFSPTKLIALSSTPSTTTTATTTTRTWPPVVLSRLWRQGRVKMTFKIVKRSVLLFGIGLALSAAELIGEPADSLWLRVPGVLQRISVCYLVMAMTVLWAPIRTSGSNSNSNSTNNSNSNSNSNRSNSRNSARNISSNTNAYLDSSVEDPASSPSSSPQHRNTGATRTRLFDPAFSSSTSSPSFSTSRIALIGPPLLCTLLWFILTYAVQSPAMAPSSDDAFDSPLGDCEFDPLPGGRLSRGQLSPQSCTSQAYLDTVLFAEGHDPNYPLFDSEGSTGTLMAIVTAWFGWMMGSAVMEQQKLQKLENATLTRQIQTREQQRQQLLQQQQLQQQQHQRKEGLVSKDSAERSARLEMDERPIVVVVVSSDVRAPSSSSSSASASSSSPSPSPSPSCIDDTIVALQRELNTQRRRLLLAHLGQWFMAGTCILFSGTMLGWFLPICKSLWTPSFTLYCAGLSILSLCILMYLYDLPSSHSFASNGSPPASATPIKPGSSWRSRWTLTRLRRVLRATLEILGQGLTHLLTCYGRNPTLIYILSELVKLILDKIHVDSPYDWMQSAWSFTFFNSFITFMPPAWASLVFSLVYILIFAPLVWFLDRKGLYLRV
ncbi:hypothetical protein EDD11_007241 [Mortierella claussenii]|nr:hypothetical protein EDD11_007241 [Mortierella claussenii]